MKIQVIGVTAEGKTAIASYLERALTLAGFDPKVIDDGEEQYLSNYDMQMKLQSLRDIGLHLTIETVQAQREATKQPEKR